MSSSSSLSSHDSGGRDGGGKALKSSFSFSSRKSAISHCCTVPMAMSSRLLKDNHPNRNNSSSSSNNRSSSSKHHPKELFLLRGHHRHGDRVGSLPCIRKFDEPGPSHRTNNNKRYQQNINSGRLSTQNEEWDISEVNMSRERSHSLFSAKDFKLPQFVSKSVVSAEKRHHHSEEENEGEGGASVVGAGLGGPSKTSLASQLLMSSVASTPARQQEDSRTTPFRISPSTSNNTFKAPMSCIKDSNSKKKSLQVTFSETKGSIPQDTRPIDINLKWYTDTDHEHFLNDATVRASLTDRTMKYAAMNERSYNSSTGLTSPYVLKEYLSSPEEIIGVEHLLTVQKVARESLKLHHAKALMKEQSRQKREIMNTGGSDGGVSGRYDPYLLASRLRSASTISSHMAQERALYITQMD